jgi:MFS transporter, MHS family, proline/betaine transporter
LLTRGLAPEALDRWGWRVPFLFGLLIGPVGLYIRRHLEETSVESRAELKEKLDLGIILAAHVKEVLVCMGIVIAGTIKLERLTSASRTFSRLTSLGHNFNTISLLPTEPLNPDGFNKQEL